MWFYSFASSAVDLLTRLLTKRTVVGRENVPLDGPVLLVSNHLSLIDPPLIGAVAGRVVHFMAKEELFRTPLIKWVVKGYLAFPVRRGEADRQALQTTLNYLRRGEVVAIFPEGTRSIDATLHQAHPGAALIALRSRAQILPVAVTGTQDFFHWPRRSLRPEVRVVIGRPFTLSADGEGLKGAALVRHADRMMMAIAELLPVTYRGQYGGTGAEVESLR